MTPTQAGSVTVQATAAAIAGKFSSSTASYTLTVTDTREWTVTCHVGNNSSNVVRTNGTTLSLDEPAAICGMSFAGWSSTNNAASPSWVENTTIVTSNMELYAMFEAVAASGYCYRLVEADQTDWRGDYLIAYDSNTFADGRIGGTVSKAIGDSGVRVDPDDKLSGKDIDVSWGDKYHVAIAGAHWVDITLADKGTGVTALCRHLGIGLESVAAFGDNYNDIPILDLVGYPYMKSTSPEDLLNRYPNTFTDVVDVLKTF